MPELFSEVRVGAFARRLVTGHIDHGFATMSTGSAKHRAERLLISELPDLLGQASATLDLKPWKVKQGILTGRKIPYLQVNRHTVEDPRETLHGVYRAGEGIHLSCEGLIIDSDSLPLTLYTALQAKLEHLLEKGTFETDSRPRLSTLIDLSIPGYDPVVTSYETKYIMGGEQMDLRTDQPTTPWPEFRREIEASIKGREGRAFD